MSQALAVVIGGMARGMLLGWDGVLKPQEISLLCKYFALLMPWPQSCVQLPLVRRGDEMQQGPPAGRDPYVPCEQKGWVWWNWAGMVGRKAVQVPSCCRHVIRGGVATWPALSRRGPEKIATGDPKMRSRMGKLGV